MPLTWDLRGAFRADETAVADAAASLLAPGSPPLRQSDGPWLAVPHFQLHSEAYDQQDRDEWADILGFMPTHVLTFLYRPGNGGVPGMYARILRASAEVYRLHADRAMLLFDFTFEFEWRDGHLHVDPEWDGAEDAQAAAVLESYDPQREPLRLPEG